MEIWFWHTWLGFIGVVAGVLVAALTGGALPRYGLLGLVGAIILVIAWNGLGKDPPPCLPNAKGMDILRAYNFDCLRSQQTFMTNLIEGKKKDDLLGPRR